MTPISIVPCCCSVWLYSTSTNSCKGTPNCCCRYPLRSRCSVEMTAHSEPCIWLLYLADDSHKGLESRIAWCSCTATLGTSNDTRKKITKTGSERTGSESQEHNSRQNFMRYRLRFPRANARAPHVPLFSVLSEERRFRRPCLAKSLRCMSTSG